MTGATLFSGIGAPECALPEVDWQFCAEIEAFPSTVHKTRFPHVPNLGDITAPDFIDRAKAILNGSTLDVLVFGSPCQGFSVAGKRLGLDDPRSNLALHSLRIVRDLAPRWFLFENVPGLFSSWSGAPPSPDGMDPQFQDGGSIHQEFIESADFAEWLRWVSDIGYFGAWTVLDAQYAGVAQRRERVFFVGHPGDWRGPAAVLLEPESLCGYPPSRKEAREGVAGATAPSLTCRYGASSGQDIGQGGATVIDSFTPCGHGGYAEGVGSLRANGGDLGAGYGDIDNGTVGALCARDSKTVGNQFVNEGKVIPCER